MANLFGSKPKTPEGENAEQTVVALEESKVAIQRAIQEVVEETRGSVRAAIQEVKGNSSSAQMEAKGDAAGEKSGSLRPEVRPHAFAVMPFGKKKGSDGSPYDFNAIYRDLIKPALEMAGFEAFRADEATTSGDILTDMFQELLLADLVICDMSIDNANAFYELGIRHAFRKRGVVHIQAGRAYMPFDVFNVRTLPYHITPEGVPDPDYLEKDKQAIARMTRDTWASDPDAVHSPVFNLLPGLPEPDRKSLRTPLATGFWREYDEWRERVAVAQRQKRIGDILLLTEEITNPLIREEAVGEAGKALANMGCYELALAQYRKGLEINPRNLRFRREEAFHLNRLGQVDEAIVKIESLLSDVPTDGEAIAYLGRIYKAMWSESWKWAKDKEQKQRLAFESYHWLVKAFHTYLKGYRVDLNECYPGVNAVTLATTLIHLADKYDNAADPDPDIALVRALLPELRGALQFALETKAEDEAADYWTLISLAELNVLIADTPQPVVRSYRKALTASRRNIFYLQSSIDQLEMLQSLDMRTEFVDAAIKVLREELARIRKEDFADTTAKKEAAVPADSQVFLFTGHSIDRPKSHDAHFPASMQSQVRDAIVDALDKYKAGPNDLAVLAGLSAGSELIFAEVCAERGIPVKAYFPSPDAVYIRDFVAPCGDAWTERFYKTCNHPLVSERYQAERLGKPKAGDDLYERNNRWALYSSLGNGIGKVRLIAVWDGKTPKTNDRGARLVKHMIDLMRETGGVVEQINPGKLGRSNDGSKVQKDKK